MLTELEAGKSEPVEGMEKPSIRRIFATTHWSVVLEACEGDPVASRQALEALCQSYWYPIYVYVRRKGHGPEEAQDLTQEFFLQFIAKEHLRLADRNKGRFRTFLLAFLDYFLAREWTRAHRQKRGGHCQFISLDQADPEERYQLEPPAPDHSPEQLFHRQWALALLARTMASLEEECATEGKTQLFRELRPQLSGDRDRQSAAEVAVRLGMNEGAVRVAVHRLRRRFGVLLRQHIQQTVAHPDQVDEELRFLRQVLAT